MNDVWRFLIFFTPAFVANMAPPFFRKLRFATWPIDGGRTYRGHRVLGDNKTWRGLFIGTIAGGLVGHLLAGLGVAFVPWWGYVLGFAALLGDAIKSFFKRQIGIKPGGRWVPFDQLDYMIVAFLASLAFTRFSMTTTVLGFTIVFVGTVVVQILGGVTGIKRDSL